MRKNQYESLSWKDIFLSLAIIIGLISLTAILSSGLMAQKRKTSRAGTSLKVVKTKIPVAYKAHLAASDDIIVFGTGFNDGIEYIKPGDSTARKIPGGDKLSSKFFTAIGTKIVVANGNNFTITVYDTATNKLTEIPESKLKLRSIGGSMFEGGSIQSSGNYAVVITDTGGKDNSALKVIDVSGAEPRVIRFEGSGPDRNTTMVFRQVAIDAKSGMVAGGGADNNIKIFDITNPEQPPKSIDLEKYKGIGTAQMCFDDGKILFQTGEAYQRAMLLDVKGEKVTEMSRAKYGMAMAGGSYVYFADRDSADSSSITGRAAVGKVGTQPKFSVGATPVGGSKNNGVVGFGGSAAITPDGKQIFIAGMQDVGRTERFQIYRGAKFALYPDASVNPKFLNASDVVASSNIIAFKVGRDNLTTLGYIKLK